MGEGGERWVRKWGSRRSSLPSLSLQEKPPGRSKKYSREKKESDKKKPTWFRYQKSSTGLPPTLTSLRDPFGRSSGLRTGTQLDEEEASAAAAAEEEAAATAVVVVVAGGKEFFFFFFL